MLLLNMYSGSIIVVQNWIKFPYFFIFISVPESSDDHGFLMHFKIPFNIHLFRRCLPIIDIYFSRSTLASFDHVLEKKIFIRIELNLYVNSKKIDIFRKKTVHISDLIFVQFKKFLYNFIHKDITYFLLFLDTLVLFLLHFNWLL